ncbi:hypothetical protein L208DRAFT_1388031 [Tricholoma matsutake]|nr:hypothetical protein L208DRAFT_1388031 [Tricholoma matsutake 945]
MISRHVLPIGWEGRKKERLVSNSQMSLIHGREHFGRQFNYKNLQTWMTQRPKE